MSELDFDPPTPQELAQNEIDTAHVMMQQLLEEREAQHEAQMQQSYATTSSPLYTWSGTMTNTTTGATTPINLTGATQVAAEPEQVVAAEPEELPWYCYGCKQVLVGWGPEQIMKQCDSCMKMPSDDVDAPLHHRQQSEEIQLVTEDAGLYVCPRCNLMFAECTCPRCPECNFKLHPLIGMRNGCPNCQHGQPDQRLNTHHICESTQTPNAEVCCGPLYRNAPEPEPGSEIWSCGIHGVACRRCFYPAFTECQCEDGPHQPPPPTQPL